MSLFANCRSQFLLDRRGRCIKLIVSSESISCHEFASQFGLEFVLYAKNPKPIVNTESTACCLFQCITDRPLSRQRRKRCTQPWRTDWAHRYSEQRRSWVGVGVGVCLFASLSVCARACVRACMHACVRDVFAIYDNDILPRLIMIIIKIIILYLI